ncbi:MAG: pilus assembly PilX N-terminal domain-containing protein, partial [Actinomycetota bacterium]|nr:pilus assembly PilX N-terminal domain-containing protein [Actinomycetota bacterium]
MRKRTARYLRARLQDERGVAIITALLISMIVVTLGATSVALAVHNSEASSFDRRRVQSIAAAEAGVNFYFSHLQSGAPEDFDCAISETLASTPAARFDATVTFYNAAEVPLPCP